MYRLDDILSLIDANKNIEIEPPIPACPKHADMECAKIAGQCPIGNAKRCKQRFEFYINQKEFVTLYPIFVIANNTQIGFFKESDIKLNSLFNKGVIKKPQSYSC